MIKLSSLTSRLQVAVLLHVLCLVATSLARDQRKCHQLTEFTFYDRNNPEGPVTCKTCPSCPAGQGLPVQCGSRVPIGTPTDCVPCKAETFSESEDVSHCKSCNTCGKKIVLQQCTPKQNRECGGCPQGYYLNHVDECKECHYCCNNVSEQDRLEQCKDLGLPRNQWCEATEANKQCKIKDSLVNTTAVSPIATVTPLPKMDSTTTVSADVPTGGNTATPNSTAKPSKLKPSHINITQTVANLTNDADQGLSGSNSQQSQHDHFKEKQLIAIGCLGGALAIMIIMVFLYVFKLRHSSRRLALTHNHASADQAERQPLTELKTNSLVNNQPNAHGRASPSSENQSTTSSASVSTESIHVQNEEPIHEDNIVNLDIQQIPEERIVSDMEWLRDDKGNLMLFFVQKQLDPVETAHNKTWRSVGLASGVSSETLNLIDTSYKAEKSPTEALIQHLRTRADGGPTIRNFVEALRTCERHDVARSICNWPWELEENSERQAC